MGGLVHRLLEPIGNIPPAEAEAAYYVQLEATPTGTYSDANSVQHRDGRVELKQTCLRQTRRRFRSGFELGRYVLKFRSTAEARKDASVRLLTPIFRIMF